MIVGFAGLARSGKDTAAGLLMEHGFRKYALATPLKKACREVFGLSDDQIHGAAKDVVDPRYGVAPRHIFQLLGTDCVRGIAPDAFVDRFSEWYGANAPGRVVVPDVRFPNEVDAIHALGGKVYRIRRGPDVADTLNHASERPSELDVDGVIRNDGTMEYLRAVLFSVVPVKSRVADRDASLNGHVYRKFGF